MKTHYMRKVSGFQENFLIYSFVKFPIIKENILVINFLNFPKFFLLRLSTVQTRDRFCFTSLISNRLKLLNSVIEKYPALNPTHGEDHC